MSGRAAVRRAVLVRYRVMAYTTAVLLVVLVFAGIPLQVFADRPGVVNVVGTMHGFLYIVYLVVAFDLTRRLEVARWKMLLVLLAGTVPFCAFVAERKMTRRFAEVEGDGGHSAPPGATTLRHTADWGAVRRRWFSARAVVLHAEVLVLAPVCALAGWWQATRALDGNGLSWVYSVEWPIFAILAVIGWWHLVHEDPDAYRARRWRSRDRAGDAPAPAVSTASTAVDAATVLWAGVLAAGTGTAMLAGFAALALIPFDRPSRWVPAHGAALYGLHASVSLVVGFAALAFVVWARPHGRIARISSWSGAACLALSSAGGLLTEPDSIVRFLGIAVMFVGAALALAAYLVPVALRKRVAPPAPAKEPVSA